MIPERLEYQWKVENQNFHVVIDKKILIAYSKKDKEDIILEFSETEGTILGLPYSSKRRFLACCQPSLLEYSIKTLLLTDRRKELELFFDQKIQELGAELKLMESQNKEFHIPHIYLSYSTDDLKIKNFVNRFIMKYLHSLVGKKRVVHYDKGGENQELVDYITLAKKSEKLLLVSTPKSRVTREASIVSEANLMKHLPKIKNREAIAKRIFNFLKEVDLIYPIGILKWQDDYEEIVSEKIIAQKFPEEIENALLSFFATSCHYYRSEGIAFHSQELYTILHRTMDDKQRGSSIVALLSGSSAEALPDFLSHLAVVRLNSGAFWREEVGNTTKWKELKKLPGIDCATGDAEANITEELIQKIESLAERQKLIEKYGIKTVDFLRVAVELSQPLKFLDILEKINIIRTEKIQQIREEIISFRQTKFLTKVTW